jgi:hypothetical protein
VEAGAIPLSMKLLCSGSAKGSASAMGALGNLAAHSAIYNANNSRAAVVVAGAIPLLVELLRREWLREGQGELRVHAGDPHVPRRQ